MKWVTRQRARVDRIAWPWLTDRFIDRDATCLCGPSSQMSWVADGHGRVERESQRGRGARDRQVSNALVEAASR
jgi:hypothetical protein